MCWATCDAGRGDGGQGGERVVWEGELSSHRLWRRGAGLLASIQEVALGVKKCVAGALCEASPQRVARWVHRGRRRGLESVPVEG